MFCFLDIFSELAQRGFAVTLITKSTVETMVPEFESLDSSITLQEEKTYLIVDGVPSQRIDRLQQIANPIPLDSCAFCLNERSYRHLIALSTQTSTRSVADAFSAKGFPCARIAPTLSDLKAVFFMHPLIPN